MHHWVTPVSPLTTLPNGKNGGSTLKMSSYINSWEKTTSIFIPFISLLWSWVMGVTGLRCITCLRLVRILYYHIVMFVDTRWW